MFLLLGLLPWRVPVPCDLAQQLAVWLRDGGDDGSSVASERKPRPEFSAAECATDLAHLAALRTRVHDDALQRQNHNNDNNDDMNVEKSHNNDHDDNDDDTTMALLQEYAAALKEFETRGFPVTDLEGEGLALAWRTASTTALTPHTETHNSLTWERANVLWNMAVLCIARGNRSAQCGTRVGWAQAATQLQNAATVIQHIRKDLLATTGSLHSSLAFSGAFLELWQAFALAEAQRSAYQNFAQQPRPKHFVLAKLASAAAPLFQTVEELCQSDLRFRQIDLILDWEDNCRGWGMWMTALTEYHQSVVHREKKEHGLELARLEGALKFGTFCKEFCESDNNSDWLAGLALQVNPVLADIDQRFATAERENQTQHHESIPEHDELPEVAPQMLVKTDPDISKLLPALSKPLFTAVMDPKLREYVDLFRSEIQKIVAQTERLADEKTENARSALAVVNLPHSLTVYRQEQNGGGIPEELWERVEHVQRERKDDRLQQELWNVRGLADSARNTFQQIEEQLQQDLEMDGMFREQNPDFEGHDVKDIQKPFRQALQNYHRLMVSARESDALLSRRSEILENDPKFRLLKLQKSQLDRLLPAGGGGSSTNNSEIDVSLLSDYLVELSALFNERDSLLHALKEHGKTYNIASDLIHDVPANATDDDYRNIVEEAKASFYDIVNEMEANIEQQTKLLYKIMQENDQFVRVRDQSHWSSGGSVGMSSDSALVKIEDALEEIDQFLKHLQEGRTFYDVVIPRLEKLHNQVREVGSRLTQERRDYEEYAHRQQQRQQQEQQQQQHGGGPRRYPSIGHDAYDRGGGGAPRTMSGRQSYGNANTNNHHAERRSSSTRPSPGAQAINHVGGRPEVRVNDEFAASLIGMEFDPDRVVAALKNYDNNFEQALNHLLSG